jgi:hypothetical protein
VRAWSCLALLACDGRAAPSLVDAGTQLQYRLSIVRSEPDFRPPHDPAPSIFINGVEAESLTIDYPDLAAASSDRHRVELRHGDHVIAQLETAPSAGGCELLGPIRSFEQSLCGFDSGDLRYAGYFVMTDRGTCIGDGFCRPACDCGRGERCTSRVVLRDPLASHLGCAPIGPGSAGDACSLIDDPAGAYDSCGDRLLCVDGTCRSLCNPQLAGACRVGRCVYVPGHAPELGVCE